MKISLDLLHDVYSDDETNNSYIVSGVINPRRLKRGMFYVQIRKAFLSHLSLETISFYLTYLSMVDLCGRVPVKCCPTDETEIN